MSIKWAALEVPKVGSRWVSQPNSQYHTIMGSLWALHMAMGPIWAYRNVPIMVNPSKHIRAFYGGIMGMGNQSPISAPLED